MKVSRDSRCNFAREGFEDDRKCAGSLDGVGITKKLLYRVGASALHFETAERVDGLRREAHVAHHKNFSFDEPRDQLDAALAAFDFHGFGAAFLDKSQSSADGIVDGGVIAAVRHVGHN